MWPFSRKRDQAPRIVLSKEERESEYLHSSRWTELLVLRPDGMPPMKLVRRGRDLWLAERRTGKLVNVGNRSLAALGLWTMKVRGGKYHEEALRRADMSSGEPVVLTREPDNEFDRNAIAIHASHDTGVLGYVNKQMAARLSKRLDAGEQYEALCLSFQPLKVLAAKPEVIRWLRKG